MSNLTNNDDPPTGYALYVDDIGSGTPGTRDAFPYFGLGGVLIKRSDESTVRSLLRQFKDKWNIERETPLHGAEIRTMKDRFHFLAKLPTDKMIEFKKEILDLIIAMPVIVHGCIVHRESYYNRYYKTYERGTWNMRKSAASILLERCVKFVQSAGGESLAVYFELCGSAEDAIFRSSYDEMRSKGHPFNQQNAEKYAPLDACETSIVLAEKPFGRRKDNELLQVADLCLFPLATSRNGKQNKAFEQFISHKKLVDTVATDSTMNAKFYCFDF
jgi:hypothetical protein